MGHHIEDAGNPHLVGDPQGRHELYMGREDRGYHIATDDHEHILPGDNAQLMAAVQAQDVNGVHQVLSNGPQGSWFNRLCDRVISLGDAQDPIGVAELWMTARRRHPV